jgi:class 3 adenylate cyclase
MSSVGTTAGDIEMNLDSSAENLSPINARVRHTLENGIQIDLTRESCKKFLRRHVDHKIAVVVLYVDIERSTRMSISLPAAEFASVLQIFSQEMTLLVEDYGGYVLKYVGDAVIALFPAEHDKHQASRNALRCAKDMQEILQGSVNPELVAHRLPELGVKISLDYGELLVVLYGKSLRSHIDTVGSSISIAAKMLAFAKVGQIVVGDSFYNNLNADASISHEFTELKVSPSEWSYIDEKSGARYKLHLRTGRAG